MICLVAPEFLGPFQNGGVGTSCYWEATTLANAGLEVTVLYTGLTERETPEYWERHYASNGPFAYVDLSQWARASGAAQRVAGMEFPCPEARVSQLVFEYLRQRQFELILFQEFLGHGARALQARESGFALHGARTVVTLHSCRQWIYEGMCRLPVSRDDTVVDFLERESTRLADRVIAPSKYMAEWARDRWRIERAIDVVPNCYDAGVSGAAEVIDHTGPFSHLVFFGRLETRKGLHLFLRALADSDVVRTKVTRVTFLGRHSRVEERPSEEFLADALSKMPWLQVDVRTDVGSLEALAWLQAQSNTLVVAPSLGDNLPYAAVELHVRRIPFISTCVGGIPDIVGENNSHQLAAPTVSGIRTVLERVCSDGRLTIDYRSGYDAASANRGHVDLVNELLSAPPATAHGPIANELTIVVTDADDESGVREVETTFATRAVVMPPGTQWSTLNGWRRLRGSAPALFVSRTVVPEAALVSSLLHAVSQPYVDAATSFVGTAVPLGASLENGWRWNCFGGPCFIATAAAFPAIDAVAHGRFATWPAYAAIACTGLQLGMVPTPLYRVTCAHDDSFDDVQAVISWYSVGQPKTLDLGWVLKIALPSSNRNGAGRALYDRLTSVPDDELRGYVDLVAGGSQTSVFRNLSTWRRTLEPLLAAWDVSQPRVFVSGAGSDVRALLATCPGLGRFVGGFIDATPETAFLGKPCVRPSAFRDGMADVVLHLTRELEYETLRGSGTASVTHVPLYHQPPAHLSIN